ncbi:MAG: prepilin-type N-terminal cleavage/methylation domain-containing protein [Alphaproteobacteria bacterium]|nr:prepilin-type N-terminal cleavage/methylation domain-containing protein [Alphaproteobacteria bacterium]
MAANPRAYREAGFTLIELMIVVATIGILAAIAVPRFSVYMLEGRVNAAKPYMLAIAAKERQYYTQYGSYVGVTSEDTLMTSLGVDVGETGDFCFVVICTDGTGTPAKCNPVAGTGFSQAASGAETIDFEVLAILRASAAGNVVGNATSCTPATDKPDPSGWVKTSASGERGREGQFAVLRYPPPADGLRAGATDQQWMSGISIYNTMFE